VQLGQKHTAMSQEGLQRYNTQPCVESVGSMLGSTPEPEERCAAAGAAEDVVIAEICLAESLPGTEASSAMASLGVTCPAHMNSRLISVGRLDLKTVIETSKEYIPAWAQRVIDQGDPAGSVAHLQLIDEKRTAGQQVGPRLAAFIWLQRKDHQAPWDCTIRACSTLANNLNEKHLMSNGEDGWQRIPHDTWQRLPTGTVLHFVTRANDVMPPFTCKPYDVFRFGITLTSPIVRLQRAAAGTPHFVKIVLRNVFMRRVMKALEQCRQQTSCDITASDYDDYHPMAKESQGRTIELEGQSAAALINGVLAVIDAAMEIEPATGQKPEKPGLSMSQEGFTIAVPNGKVGAFLGEGGRQQQQILDACDLQSLKFGVVAPGDESERLLQARGTRDGIKLLVSHATSLLGPSPSGYAKRINKKRARAEDAGGGRGGGNGNSVLPSRQKKRKEKNVVNKQKHTASKKQKHSEKLARDATAKTRKKQLQEIQRRLDENPELMRLFNSQNGNGGSSSGGGNSTANSTPSSRGGGRGRGGAQRGGGRGRGGGGGRGRGNGGGGSNGQGWGG